jgi:CheY-like chemotaxis protein
LSQTLRAVNRAADLIKQILTFSRETPSRKGEASIQAVIDETVPLLQSSLGKNIVLDVRSDSEVRNVLADSLQIQQILINLCVNARDAMPEGGTITVRAQNIVVTEHHRGRPADARPGNYVRLQVRDRGIGMDTPTQERIFMPFFTTKPVGQGTGLGLSVTYGIVAEHRGWIEVDSAPGAGTAFSIYLPALEGEAREEVPEVAPGKTVLISESDHELRQKLVEALEDRGYYTLAAEDNSEALALFWAEADYIDLVICDGSSPGMEVGQLMRNLWTENEDVKILTTIPETAPRRTYTSPFGSELATLQKPFTAEQMLAAIEKLLTVGVGRV